MIHYALHCSNGHDFDGWFRDSATFESQAAKGLVACPHCHDTTIERAVMAPSIARHRVEPAAAPTLLDERHKELRSMIRQLRETIVEATEDVGENFPAEARAIDEGEAQARPIRGKASLAEAKALIEDGIEILPVPGLAED